MSDYDEDGLQDEECSNNEEDYATKVRDIDNEIQAALIEFNQGDQTKESKDEYFRKRNALYSQRKYYRVKLSISSLSREKRELSDTNTELKTEHKKLKLLLSMANDQVRDIEIDPSIQSSTRANISVDSLSRGPLALKAPPAASVERPLDIPGSLPAAALPDATGRYINVANAIVDPDLSRQIDQLLPSRSLTASARILQANLLDSCQTRFRSDAGDSTRASQGLLDQTSVLDPLAHISQVLRQQRTDDSNTSILARFLLESSRPSSLLSATTDLSSRGLLNPPNVPLNNGLECSSDSLLGASSFYQRTNQAFSNSGLRNPENPPTKSDILLRLDNVRRLQQTVNQELQDLVNMQDARRPSTSSREDLLLSQLQTREALASSNLNPLTATAVQVEDIRNDHLQRGSRLSSVADLLSLMNQRNRLQLGSQDRYHPTISMLSEGLLDPAMLYPSQTISNAGDFARGRSANNEASLQYLLQRRFQ